MRASYAAALLALVGAMHQPATVTAGVRAWPSPAAGSATSMLGGATRDMASLDVRAVALAPHRAADRIGAHAGTELLLIVKEGPLTVTLGGATKTLSPGSVVLALPGDEPVVRNDGSRRASYYLFAYRSRKGPDAARGRQAGGSAMIEWKDVAVQPTETGARRQPLDRATTMFERLEMHVSTLKSGLTNHPPHTHGAEECVVMIHGNVRMVIGDGRQSATNGDVVFLTSMIPHSLDNVGADAAEYFAFQWQ